MFAGTDDNLGRTDVVKHNIKTGDATPIKQPPRRLPVHRRKEGDKLVDVMLERCDRTFVKPMGIRCCSGKEERRDNEVLCRLPTSE